MPQDDTGDTEERKKDAEIVRPDVVENGPTNHSPSEEFERLATYSITENGTTYKIIPELTREGARWKIAAYGSAQGSLEMRNGISDEQAVHLGLSPGTQQDLNAALFRAKEEIELPPAFRGQTRQKRTLDDLKQTLKMD